MSDISYTYNIIKVDNENRCMEIVYENETYGKMHIGARLPYENETLEDIVRAFSPVAMWREKAMNVLPVEENTAGSLTDSLDIDEQPLVNEDIDRVQKLSELYADAPAARIWSIQQIENLQLNYTKFERFRDSKNNLKAIEIVGPLGSDDPYAGYDFMLNSRTAVSLCKELGVPFFAVTTVQNLIDFAVNDMGASKIETGEFTICYFPWNPEMEAARLSALATEVREQRNQKLLETDWIHLPDSPEITNMSEWEAYRQALRDITQQENFPTDVNWPTKPDVL